jgi:hypothetical protein
VRALNRRATSNWLDLLNQPAWSARKAQIRNMVDYACARTLNYIGSLGNGDSFTVAGVNDEFFNGTRRVSDSIRERDDRHFHAQAMRSAPTCMTAAASSWTGRMPWCW